MRRIHTSARWRPLVVDLNVEPSHKSQVPYSARYDQISDGGMTPLASICWAEVGNSDEALATSREGVKSRWSRIALSFICRPFHLAFLFSNNSVWVSL